MVKGFLPIKEYYDFVLEKCHEGLSQEEIELALARHSKYQRLVRTSQRLQFKTTLLE